LAGCLSAAGSFEEIQSRISSFTLKNGMTFIVMARHRTPVASFPRYADVGSVQEVKGITGLAHTFEHMAFNGSPRWAAATTKKNATPSIAWTRPFSRSATSGARARRPTRRNSKTWGSIPGAQEGAGKFVVKNEYGEAIERAGGRDFNAGTAQDWLATSSACRQTPPNSASTWNRSTSFVPVMREFYKEKDVVMEKRHQRNESPPKDSRSAS
jgi:predicted Zn-dependent peptidase